MPKYFIQTHGCQMNQSDTERAETYLEALGYDKSAEFDDADIIMFNTCSIKQKAEDKVMGKLNQIPKLRRKNPELLVVITGCMVRKSSSKYSEKRDELLTRNRDIDICLRIDELSKFAGLIREISPDSKIKEIPEESLEDYFKIKATHSSTTPIQAFVPISTGCDKFCTYCIVPFSRGRERSRDLADIIAEVTGLVENGCKEVTLVGQTVNSYGLSVSDKISKKFAYLAPKEPFVHLLEELDKLKSKGLERVRFTSPHPRDMSDQLIEAMATLKTQMPYLHLPVQSGDDRTLKRMNRTYNIEKYLDTIKKLRSKIPDISISTDIIVGFCGETDEEYENTYKFFENVGFEHAYISQYSERRGTFAAKKITDDIPAPVKHERWHRLNDLLRKLSTQAHKKFEGKVVKVIVESQEGDECLGRSEHFKTVRFKAGRNLVGHMVPVKVIEAKEWLLDGELV